MKLMQVSGRAWMVLAVALVVGCSSRAQVGDESHFQACSDDVDCKNLGAGYACVEKLCKVVVADAGADSGGGVPDGGVPGCSSVAVSTPVSLEDPEGGNLDAATFAVAGPRFVAVWSAAGNAGTRVGVLDQAGAIRDTATVWPGVAVSGERSVAVAGDTLAIVDQAGEGAEARQTCRLGLVGASALSSIQVPTRVSDAPDPGSVLNEAEGCRVVATDADFVVVWAQLTSNTRPRVEPVRPAVRPGRQGARRPPDPVLRRREVEARPRGSDV
ncbi:MAG: hypothetical protein FJ104_00730 [Deltaproteobacteria bacterium]|nr:hypothetical protein [Deltaproteobacteria bacterium]